jgi:hypothetical protein
LSPAARKLTLTLHIASSVGWLGAVAGFLALAIAGATANDVEVARAAYIAMEATGRAVLVPLALASLATGIIQALGSRWGLLSHYWVVTKLAATVIATGVLLLYLQTLEALAEMARSSSTTALQSPSPALHALGAVMLLAIALVLSVYKPRGVTAYGWRRQQSS